MRTDELVVKVVTVKEDGDLEMYIEAEGKRIAKRGQPGTPHARTWISLEPGWAVRDVRNYDGTTLGRWEHRDGTVIYVVPGLEPDAAETLKRDGLIETDWGQPATTKVFFPNNSRVLARQMTVNEACRRRGRPRDVSGRASANLPVTGTEARAMSKREVATALTKGGGD